MYASFVGLFLRRMLAEGLARFEPRKNGWLWRTIRPLTLYSHKRVKS
jgi:hypothetical protein